MMKNIVMALFLWLFVSFVSVSFVFAGTTPTERQGAERQTILNSVTDWAATVGKSPNQKRKIKRQRKEIRKQARLQKILQKKRARKQKQIRRQNATVVEKEKLIRDARYNKKKK